MGQDKQKSLSPARRDILVMVPDPSFPSPQFGWLAIGRRFRAARDLLGSETFTSEPSNRL
jgi:hypothetical protein